MALSTRGICEAKGESGVLCYEFLGHQAPSQQPLFLSSVFFFSYWFHSSKSTLTAGKTHSLSTSSQTHRPAVARENLGLAIEPLLHAHSMCDLKLSSILLKVEDRHYINDHGAHHPVWRNSTSWSPGNDHLQDLLQSLELCGSSWPG